MGPGLKANTAPFVTRSRWQQSLSWMASPFQRRDCALRIIRQSATSDTFKGSPPTPSSFVNVCIFGRPSRSLYGWTTAGTRRRRSKRTHVTQLPRDPVIKFDINLKTTFELWPCVMTIAIEEVELSLNLFLGG